ncbi:MAG: efflux RND transporter periplasmic adaptor subunit [Candidatus Cloacimonetes bacterium]|nr:efflux RND transporter periplasmic adaptor subunit [Candidatus Cloacimonadota bacterium]MBS3767841.1 efflux RND transporter periplasmic adaptor subunit [Candidatus Cloacimonadota bacterium]
MFRPINNQITIWKISVLIILLGAFFASGCGRNGEIESKSMSQIHKDDGIPIKVKTVKPEMFEKKLEYTGTLTGNRQSIASAMVGGRIEKILVDIGDYVEEDQVIMTFPPDNPSSQYKQAKAAFQLSKKTYDRMKNLYEKGGISKQKLDQIKTQYEVDKANWLTAKKMVKVEAPISGIVTEINVNETDNVRAESPLATISNIEKLKSTIWANSDEVEQIDKGMQASVLWNEHVLAGKVTNVAISKDPAQNAFRVDLVFENPDEKCKPGIIADIEIETYSNPSAFVVERKNVGEDAKGRYVFIVKNNKAKKAYIQVGESDGAFEIDSGIKQGDKVIVEGLNLVKDGSKVQIIQ